MQSLYFPKKINDSSDYYLLFMRGRAEKIDILYGYLICNLGHRWIISGFFAFSVMRHFCAGSWPPAEVNLPPTSTLPLRLAGPAVPPELVKRKGATMDRRCSICTHSDQQEINRALMEGESLRSLAARYGLSVSALSRHTKHLRQALANGADENRQRHHDALLDKLDLFEHRLEHIFHKAQDHDALHISLGCVQEALRIFTLRERLSKSPSDRQ